MRCCLVLTDLPVRYRINNFTNSAIAAIEASWPAIRSTIEKTVRLANSLGSTAQSDERERIDSPWPITFISIPRSLSSVTRRSKSGMHD